jgi:hypothetical protein
LQSGDCDDDEASYLRLVHSGDPNDNLLTFSYKVSSEQNWDYFYFYLNDTLQLSGSGEIDWTEKSYILSSPYKMIWVYEKDGSVSVGSDAAWLDDITLASNSSSSVSSSSVSSSSSSESSSSSSSSLSSSSSSLSSSSASSSSESSSSSSFSEEPF